MVFSNNCSNQSLLAAERAFGSSIFSYALGELNQATRMDTCMLLLICSCHKIDNPSYTMYSMASTKASYNAMHVEERKTGQLQFYFQLSLALKENKKSQNTFDPWLILLVENIVTFFWSNSRSIKQMGLKIGWWLNIYFYFIFIE